MQMIATRGLLTTDMLCLSSSDWQTVHMENITVIINSDQHASGSTVSPRILPIVSDAK